MSQAQHTRGPWSIERLPIESRGGSNTMWKIGPMVACIYDDWRPREAGISESENEANARLIAAAPELLAAVEEGQKAVKRLVAGIEAGNTEDLNGSEWLQFQRLAVEAIAKAEERAE